MAEEILTQNELKRVLHYCPDMGIFTWRISPTMSVEAGSVCKCRNHQGYIRISICNRAYQAHRLAFLYITGSFPKHHVDHINHIGDDNRWENLRDVTMQDNMKNAKLSRINKSGVTGVYYSKKGNKWRAQITVDGRQVHLCMTDDFSEAVEARKKAEIKYGYHVNHGGVSVVG